MNGSDIVGGSFAVGVQRFQRDPLVRLVLERLVVLVDPFLLDPPIGLDGTDDLPALPPTEFDQFRRGISGVEQDKYPMPLGQKFRQFSQHAASQRVLAVVVRPLPRFPFPVELAHFLFALVHSRVKQKSDGADLNVDFHIHIAVGVHLSLAGAVGMVVMIIHRLQVARGFAWLCLSSPGCRPHSPRSPV